MGNTINCEDNVEIQQSPHPTLLLPEIKSAPVANIQPKQLKGWALEDERRILKEKQDELDILIKSLKETLEGTSDPKEKAPSPKRRPVLQEVVDTEEPITPKSALETQAIKITSPLQMPIRQQSAEAQIFTPRKGPRTQKCKLFAQSPEMPGRFQKGNRTLGSGAFGVVYLGIDKSNGRLLAIKELVIPEEKAAHEVQKEIHLLTKLRHPNIVEYYGSELHGKSAMVAMEYCCGGALSAVMEMFGFLTLSTYHRYIQDILKGLQCLHDANVIHRDIKPHNILMTSNGTCKLADFGCSKLLDQDTVDCAGTPLYMSPEVLTEGIVIPASDIWSLGITSIHLLTGNLPYSEYNINHSVTLMLKISQGLIPKIPQWAPEGLRDMILSCLKPDPKSRPSCSSLLKHYWLAHPVETESELRQAREQRDQLEQDNDLLGSFKAYMLPVEVDGFKKDDMWLPKFYDTVTANGTRQFGVYAACTYKGTKVDVYKIDKPFANSTRSKHVLRELNLLQSLRHPNLPTIKDVYIPLQVSNGKILLEKSYLAPLDLYVALPHMDITLAELIKSPTELDADHRSWFMYQILCAVEYLHSAQLPLGVIHPYNILVSATCDLYIVDLTLGEHNRYYGSSDIFRPYHSPELVESLLHQTTWRTEDRYYGDIWSVGCILAEMILRERLFSDITANTPKCHRAAIRALTQKEQQSQSKVKPLSIINAEDDVIDDYKTWSETFSHIEGMTKNEDDLLQKLLQLEQKDRLPPAQARVHKYFDEYIEENPLIDAIASQQLVPNPNADPSSIILLMLLQFHREIISLMPDQE